MFGTKVQYTGAGTVGEDDPARRREQAGIRGLATDSGIEKEGAMLWTIAVILLVLWALGMLGSYAVGGLIHLLLVIAIIVIVFQFMSGRRSI